MSQLRTLFVNPPSFRRYDSAGARCQATRRAKSMWYPVWLCYAAGLVDESRVIDCPAQGLTIKDLLTISREYDMVVIQTSTPTLMNDIRVANAIKEEKEDIKIVFVGPHVSSLPDETLRMCKSIDAIARREFDFTIQELSQGKDLSQIRGLSWRKGDKIIHNPDREPVENLDSLPFVTKIYKRDLNIYDYYLPFILYPYVSIFTGRGCPYKCTFCLWPQTFTGHKYRVRSIANVISELEFIKSELPKVKEIVFDDDTFTIDKVRVMRFCESVKPLDVTWSANVRANLDYEILKKMKDAGCRLVIVGYESGCQEILNNIKKGISIKKALEFTRDCKKLGLMIHGSFVIGLPGETREIIKRTIKFIQELDLDSLQVSIATPYPGTELYEYCLQHGYLKFKRYVNELGFQDCVIEYPHLSAEEIAEAVEDIYAKFYYRPKYIWKLLKMVIRDPREFQRIIKSGMEFNRYMAKYFLRKVITWISSKV